MDGTGDDFYEVTIYHILKKGKRLAGVIFTVLISSGIAKWGQCLGRG